MVLVTNRIINCTIKLVKIEHIYNRILSEDEKVQDPTRKRKEIAC